MKIHENCEILSLYIDGRLDPSLKKEVDVHLLSCAECREITDRMKAAGKMLSSLEPLTAPPCLEKDVMDSLESRRSFSFIRMAPAAALFMLLVILVSYSLILPGKRNEKLTSGQNPLENEGTPPAVSGDGLPGTGSLKAPEGISAKATTEEEERPVSGRNLMARIDNDGIKAELKDRPADIVPAASSAPALKVEEMKRCETEQGVREPEERAGMDAAGKKERPDIGASGTREQMGDMKVENRESEVRMLPCISSPSKSKAALPEAEPALAGAKESGSPSPLVISNRKDFTMLWNLQNASGGLTCKLPDIDFNRQMVVAIPSNAGKTGYYIVDTVEKEDGIVVQYREMPIRDPSPTPYQIRVVNRKPGVELQKVE